MNTTSPPVRRPTSVSLRRPFGDAPNIDALTEQFDAKLGPETAAAQVEHDGNGEQLPGIPNRGRLEHILTWLPGGSGHRFRADQGDGST